MDHPEILALFIPIISILVVGAIILYSVYTKHKLKQTIVDKGLVDENVKYLLENAEPAEPKSLRYRLKFLRWGLLLFFVGVGLSIGFYFEGNGNDRTFAPAMVICLGLGFLSYHMIEQSISAKEKKEKQN